MEFSNVDNIKKHVIEHSKEMEQKYSIEINESISNTIIYDSNTNKPIEIDLTNIPSIEVVKKDSVQAILSRENSEIVAVLDFASYTYPGEKYAAGNMSQEYSLFHHSYLYEVLTTFTNSYYEYNSNHKNNSLYLDRALYIPNVVFEDNKTRYCDVIVCTAPNWKIASRMYGINELQNYKAMRDRMRFVKAIAEENSIETLILGSWGTGIFGQNVAQVAYMFKEVFKNSSIKNIVYAVSDEINYEIFKEIFS